MAGADGLRCPFCNGMVTLANDVCPHCNAALLIDALEKTQTGFLNDNNVLELTKKCKVCGKEMPPGRHVCQDCASENLAIPEARKSKWDTQGDVQKKVPKLLQRNLAECILPAPIARFEDISFDPRTLDAIHAISAENPPKAVLSTDNGTIFYLVAGSTLIIGRELETSHIQTILHPEQQHAQSNFKVSRKHCRFSIESGNAFCRDVSSNGTLINGTRIERKKDVPLIVDDIISLAKVLELQVSLTVIGDRLCSMQLTRLKNGLENHYILAAGPVLFGDDPAFPIFFGEAKDIRGSIFYNPDNQAWVVEVIQRSSGACLIERKPLEFIEDIALPDGVTLLFSTIQ